MTTKQIFVQSNKKLLEVILAKNPNTFENVFRVDLQDFDKPINETIFKHD
jgi:hypothetical protein